MTFIIGRGFAELQILKKWKWPYLLNWVEYCNEILQTHWYWQNLAHGIVKCYLSIGQGFAEDQILKKVKLALAEVQILKKKWNSPYRLNLLEYFDKILQTHLYWQDLDRGIARCNLSLTEAMWRSKFWKSEKCHKS